MSVAKPRIRLRGKQAAKATSQSLPSHQSKAKVRVVLRCDKPAPGAASAPAVTEPDISAPSGDTVAQVRCEIRAKCLEDLLVGIFGKPTYFRILAVALSWLDRCSCAAALPVKVCAAALLLTGINFEGAAPLRPCGPIAHLADHFQVRRSAIVQCMAALCDNNNKS